MWKFCWLDPSILAVLMAQYYRTILRITKEGDADLEFSRLLPKDEDIERLPNGDFQSGFFADFPFERFLRTLLIIHPATHRLPDLWQVIVSGASLQDEHFPVFPPNNGFYSDKKLHTIDIISI